MKRGPAAILIMLAATACQSVSEPSPAAPPSAELTAIEAASGGRLGVALVDRGGRLVAGHRSGERFAFCSTFKLLLAGMVLDGARRGRWSLDERLPVTEADLVFHSPVTKEHVAGGTIPIGEATRATVTISDNAAANLLLRRMGGIDAFNAWLRGQGDDVTRLDRLEPALNENAAGDPRDTTTPEAIARTSAAFVFGDALAAPDRALLRQWLVESRTGLGRIRAGLPEGWTAGDKTGTCGGAGAPSYNDVAFFIPEGEEARGHILAVYLDRPDAGGEEANAVIADVARAAAPLTAARGR